MVQQTLFLTCAISYQPGALAKHHVQRIDGSTPQLTIGSIDLFMSKAKATAYRTTTEKWALTSTRQDQLRPIIDVILYGR
ncbi:hypothetical protein M405DRAFT_379875 [Rhizopogon salebrosus TDB-379]|nr:hypothetical protein M405DRAFT_379875 [Rhizopogon salebrosus TDB-379]